jgi:hypothetical protein
MFKKEVFKNYLFKKRLQHKKFFQVGFKDLPLLPILTTAFFYALCYVISFLFFDVQIFLEAIPIDFLTQLVFAYILYALSRRAWSFTILHALIMGILYIGNPIKIAFFGGPLMPDDVFALRSLLLILNGWQFIALAVVLAALVSLLFFNLTVRHFQNYIGGMFAALLTLTTLYHPNLIVEPIDKYIGTTPWNQRSNYVWQGATVHTLVETARFFLLADSAPDIDDAKEAAEFLLSQQPKQNTFENFTPRNVHLILMESFWDANQLKKVKFSKNPLADDFRKLWKSASNSTSIVPVFAGMTANSEFEALCGFPVTKDTVKFERQLD